MEAVERRARRVLMTLEHGELHVRSTKGQGTAHPSSHVRAIWSFRRSALC